MSAGLELRRWTVSAASIACVLAAWHLATEVLEVATPLVLPAPGAVLEAFVSLLTDPFEGGTLGHHVWSSLKTVLGGWLAAAAVGVPLGVLMGSSRVADAVIGPVFHLVRPIPPIAWIPLVIVWFGISQWSRILVVFIAAVIPCVINAREGVRQVDPQLVRAARSLGAGSRTILRRVVGPAAAPLMFTGLRISLGNAWMTLVGAELVAASSGLGFVLLSGRRLLQSDLVFVAMATVAVLGVLLGAILRWAEPRLIPWEVTGDHR
jgi:taurine transport system permease protein